MIDRKKINKILNIIGQVVELKAKQMASIDRGHLRSSIKYRIEGNRVIIYATSEHARNMEYGTPPGEFSEGEKEDIREWARRKNIKFASAVIRKLEREGIKVGTPKNPLKTFGTYRPFLRPALLQSIPEIKKIVKQELS